MPEVLATSCSVSSQLCCEKPLRDLQSAGATSPTPAKRGGFFGTLTPLTAADASLPLTGTSIAVHVHHVAWGMNATAAWIRADRKARDWKESWKITSVNEEAWTRLAGELRRQYDHLRQTIQSHALDGDEAFGGALGALAHLAYHLGAVRQKIALLPRR